MRSSGRILAPLFLIFIGINALLFILSRQLLEYNIDKDVLLGANLFLLVISLLSFTLQKRGLKHANPHVFVRSVMSGMLLKMLLCMAAVIIYVYASGDAYNKKGIFIALFLYLVYLAAEVFTIMKLNKKPDA